MILSFVALVCVMGLSESSAQRKPKPGKQQQAATPTPTPTPTPSPTPKPPAEVLSKIQETIDGFSKATLSKGEERTLNFLFSVDCSTACKDCLLQWDFQVYEETVEKFRVQVALSSINPKRISVDGTQVEFETNNGQTITVVTRNPDARTDYTDAWHISLRSEDGAERVANLLKQVLSESCPKR